MKCAVYAYRERVSVTDCEIILLQYGRAHGKTRDQRLKHKSDTDDLSSAAPSKFRDEKTVKTPYSRRRPRGERRERTTYVASLPYTPRRPAAITGETPWTSETPDWQLAHDQVHGREHCSR